MVCEIVRDVDYKGHRITVWQNHFANNRYAATVRHTDGTALEPLGGWRPTQKAAIQIAKDQIDAAQGEENETTATT